MKLNFRKIASVLSSAVMISSTVALAAAATYPAPFVTGGQNMVGVVFGSSAGGQLDSQAAVDIAQSLNTQITSSGSGSVTTVTGESFPIERDKNKFNLGDVATEIYTKLTSDQLSTVLADGDYNNDNNGYTYTQELALSPNLNLTYDQDSNFNDEKPFIGMDLSNKEVMNYTLSFDKSVDMSDSSGAAGNLNAIANTRIDLLGKNYYIVSATTTSNGIALTLLDTANSVSLKEGETTTVTAADGTSYDVSLSTVNSGTTNDKATFVVGGKSYSNLQAGNVRKIGTDTYLSVQTVQYSDKKESYAEFSVGSGKIYMENGQEVEINEEAVSSNDKYNNAVLNAYITNSSATKLDSVKLQWIAGDDAFIKEGSELLMPGFETIKLGLGSFTTGDYEKSTLEVDGNTAVKISTALKDDPTATIDLAYTGVVTVSGASDTLYVGTGKSATAKILKTTASDTITLNDIKHDVFVGSWESGSEAESYLLSVDKIVSAADSSGKNTTTVKSSGGLTKDINIGESEYFDNVQLKLISADKGSDTAVFQIQSNGADYAGFNYLYTAKGLRMTLPIFNATAAPAAGGSVYSTAAAYNGTQTIQLNFKEQNKNGDFEASDGGTFTVTLSIDTTDYTAVKTTSVTTEETEPDSKDYVGYVLSDVATKVDKDTNPDQGVITIYYPGTESYGNVFVAESGALVSSGNATETGKVVPVYDNELDKVAGKNLIVVGGACVNTLAAQLLGSATPLCGAAWEAKTKVGAGSFLIQTFARDNGKVATLVAGYNLEDTTNAVKALRTDKTLDISAGKAYIGNVNSVQAVTIA